MKHDRAQSWGPVALPNWFRDRLDLDPLEFWRVGCRQKFRICSCWTALNPLLLAWNFRLPCEQLLQIKSYQSSEPGRAPNCKTVSHSLVLRWMSGAKIKYYKNIMMRKSPSRFRPKNWSNVRTAVSKFCFLLSSAFLAAALFWSRIGSGTIDFRDTNSTLTSLKSMNKAWTSSDAFACRLFRSLLETTRL